MSRNRLAALKHRHQQFERQMTLELSNRAPDEDAMAFFKTQKQRINDLIEEIEGKRLQGPVKPPRTYEEVDEKRWASA